MSPTATFLDGSAQLKILFIYLFGGMLGVEPGALDMQGELSTSELHHQALCYLQIQSSRWFRHH